MTSIGSELELDPGLLQHRIGGMAGHHAVIDHDRAEPSLRPDFVVALASPLKRPTVVGEDRLQSLRIALDHSGRDVEQAFVMGDDAEPVRTRDALGVNQLVGVDIEKIG